MPSLRLLDDEMVEEMYGSYRSLQRSHRAAGQWALATWCQTQARLCVLELSRRFDEERRNTAAQLNLLDDLR
jgi:hypothetical protein